MYFYNLSEGEYSDYGYNIIYHDKKFTKQEFVEKYNYALQVIKDKEIDRSYLNMNEVSEVMCQEFNFKELKEEFEINNGYGMPKPIIYKEVDNEGTFISLKTYPVNNTIEDFWGDEV